MFKINKKIQNVRTFLVNNNIILRVDNEFNFYQDEKLLSKNVLDNGYALINSKVFYLVGMDTWIDNEKVENLSFLKESEDYQSKSLIFSGNFKLSYPNITHNYYIYNLDSKNYKFLFEYQNLFYFYRVQNLIVFSNKSQIDSYSLPTAQPLWQYDLSELVFYSDSDKKEYSYEVKAFIGIIGTSLFIKLNNNEILVLDIHSGILKEKLSFIDKMIGESSIRRPDADMPFFKTKYIIDEKASLIQALFVDLYYEIEHKNDKSYTTVFGLKNEYEKHGINPEYTSDDNVVLGDKLYFMIQDQSRFAVLNTNSKLIEYVSEPIMIENREDRFSKLKEIQVSEDKVYVLASDNTLHIFQKENRS